MDTLEMATPPRSWSSRGWILAAGLLLSAALGSAATWLSVVQNKAAARIVISLFFGLNFVPVFLGILATATYGLFGGDRRRLALVLAATTVAALVPWWWFLSKHLFRRRRKLF